MEQITDKKYPVIDAVWIAAALLAAEKYDNNHNATRNDMYFKQSVIVDRAQLLADGKVDSARVNMWLNADNPQSSRNYLRADQQENPSSRRLSMLDEFSDKTYPTGLNDEDILEMNGKPYKISQLFDFVRNIYPEVMKKMQTTDIDYIGLLDYLKNNQEIPYSNPEATTDPAEKSRLLSIKQKGQEAAAELKKIANRCEILFGLDKCEPISWLDGSNTKTRKYLWAQMKYSDFSDNPMSVSLFVEKSNSEVRFRISLEIKDAGTKKGTMTKYHTHLDMPIEDGMVYVYGSNEWGAPADTNYPQNELKEKIKAGEIRKVQLCIYIDPSAEKTNEQYDSEVTEAVRRIIPYYEHVIGKKASSNRAWLITWNSAKWTWEEYTEWCIGTKQGKHYIEPWTCASKQPSIGDEVFLIKTGESPRGVIAHGFVSKESYRAEHYDADKAADGATSSHINVEFDLIQNYETEPMLLQDELKQKLPNQQWSPMSSGIEIKEPVFTALKEMWQNMIDKKEVSTSFDKNMILYGPPGTGKTYSTAIYAVAICSGVGLDEVSKMPYDSVMDEYNKLKSEGRVAFTTFHQSYGYEEFIEGIKPVVDDTTRDIGYTIEPGVFKRFCESATRPKQEEISFTGKVWNIRNRAGDEDLTFDLNEYMYSNGVIMVEDINDDKRQCNILSRIAYGDWVILGRDFHIDAIGVIEDYEPSTVDCEPFHYQRKVKWIAKNLGATFNDIDKLGYSFSNFAVAKSKLKPNDFYSLLGSIDADTKPYVFVIDEINRGNISKIFGELITLIEDTKREGMKEQASAILPYSGDSFSVPSNVYILGTMNTADRSIALMDTALRRRFQFVEMMPETNVLRKIGADKVEGLDVAAMLETINERITFLYDREHTIGHAFFTKLKDSPNIETLASIFEKSVIPLLQEYFYEDYQKIQLVLGDNGKTDPATKFISDEEIKVKSIFKGNIDDAVDLPEKKYIINKSALTNIESYKQIIN